MINGSKAVWLRTLRVLSFERSTPPYSFESLTSVTHLKAAATRSLRIRAALEDHRLLLAIRLERYRLDHSGLFSIVSASFMMTPLTLLPGGRWLLSLAVHEGSSFVICWDVQRKVFHETVDAEGPHYSLRPAVHLELRGLRVEKSYGASSWAQVQATAEADSAIIALRSSDGHMGMTRR